MASFSPSTSLLRNNSYGDSSLPTTSGSAKVGIGPIIGGIVFGAIAGHIIEGLTYKSGAAAGGVVGLGLVKTLNNMRI